MDFAPCVRFIEKKSGALHVVTITGARIGAIPDYEIQLSPNQFSTNKVIFSVNSIPSDSALFLTDSLRKSLKYFRLELHEIVSRKG